MKLALFLLAAAVSAFGCDEPARPSGDPGPPEPIRAETATASAVAPSASASAAALPADSLEGRWEGRYDAKKGSVGVPQGVKDKTWNKDDGKIASGGGSVTLEVSPKGEVTGKSRGALGNATLTGKVDDKMLRATFMPDDPTLEHAMTGVLVGMLKDGKLKAELRVAGPDATLVREADFELARPDAKGASAAGSAAASTTPSPSAPPAGKPSAAP